MESRKKIKHIRNTIIYTILAVVLLCVVFYYIINYIYKNAEDEAFETLHMQTLTIKENINLQMNSDMENLSTMANFAAKLYSDGEGFQLLLDSFKSIGLIDNIGILLPDDTLVTKVGTLDVKGSFSFAEESLKGKYISGRVKDVTNADKELVRSSVPIVSNGKTVGILYGAIELGTLEEKYKSIAEAQDAHLYVVEQENGNFIIDTWNKKPGNISDIAQKEHMEDFSYKQLFKDISEGNSGYTAFKSDVTGEYFFAHYAPLDIEGWQIMLSKPENVVFSKVKDLRNNLFLMLLLVILIMAAYLISIFASERRQSNLNLTASKIRKRLLGINQQSEGIRDSLENITMFANARSAFFVDTDGEDYNYIMPALKSELLCHDDRDYFISELLSFAGKYLEEQNAAVLVFNITVNTKLQKKHLELYEFLKAHNIKHICFAGITDKKKHISILGVINPKKRTGVSKLLKDIAVCFSMAIYNKKYLSKTELIAVTDSLTGLSNRIEYKKDIVRFNKGLSDLFACIYIDVNELHVVNNNYGHAAGDAMLIFIASALKEVFEGNRIYRMGGDEFLVFTEDTEKEYILSSVDVLNEKVEAMNYHISIGTAFRSDGEDTEEIVKEAEKRMYEAKAEYYQYKEQVSIAKVGQQRIEYISTGIREIDATLSIMSLHYLGIYFVSLSSDKAHNVMTSEYFTDFLKNNDSYSKSFSQYVHEMVDSDFQRAMVGFLNYDVLKRQISEGQTPSIIYERIDGQKIRLSIYAHTGHEEDMSSTIWVFEKEKDNF